MKMKVFLGTSIILLMSCAMTFAKESPLQEDKINHGDKNKKNNKIKKILPDHCIFSGDFTQSRKIGALPTPLTSSGKLFFSCQHGLIWNNEKPFSESLVYTSQNLHFRKIDSNEPTPLGGQQHYYFAKFLLNLLSADIEYINEQFLVKVEKRMAKELVKKENKGKEENEEKQNITLLPRNNIIKQGLSSILIEKTLRDEKELLSIIITDNKKQTTTLSIGNLITHSKIKKENIERSCTSSFKNSAACNILSDPQAYQTIEPNN